MKSVIGLGKRLVRGGAWGGVAWLPKTAWHRVIHLEAFHDCNGRHACILRTRFASESGVSVRLLGLT